MKKSLWSDKNFTILIIGQIISLFGSAIQRFALSLYLLDLTGSASVFANILALSIVPIIVLAPFAGILADRGERKWIMVVLDVLSGLVITGYAITLFYGTDHTYVVAAVMMILSALSTLYQPAVNASIPSIVKHGDLVSANGIVQQVNSLSSFLGPILAGVLYGFGGIKVVIILNGVSFFVSAILELFLDIPERNHEKVEHGSGWAMFRSEMQDSGNYLMKVNPTAFRMMVTAGLYNLFLVPVFSVGAPYIIKVVLGFSSQTYGVSEGMIALGMILGGMYISMKPKLLGVNRVYLVLYGTCASVMAMGISLCIPRANIGNRNISLILFTVFGMVIMFALGIANVITATYMQRVTPDNMLGKVMSFTSAFATLCVPLGQVGFGKLLQVFGKNPAMLLFAAGIFAFGVTLIVRWNVRMLPNDEDLVELNFEK